MSFLAKMHFQNLECHFSPGFRMKPHIKQRNLKKHNMGINIGIYMEYINQYIYICIYSAARSYPFWGPLGTIWDLQGPSGDHHSKKLSFFDICKQNMYFLPNIHFQHFRISLSTRVFRQRPPRTSKQTCEFEYGN